MRLLAVLTAVLLAGCVSDGRSLRPGVDDAAAVRADMGAPAEVLRSADGGELWFYPRGRHGRVTFRAALDPDGRLLGVDQVLTEENFARIVDGKTTAQELRRLLGPPDWEWTSRLKPEETIWDYRYWVVQEPWILRVGIDPRGIVTGTFRGSELNAPSGDRQ
jgi:hypothetical protein